MPVQTHRFTEDAKDDSLPAYEAAATQARAQAEDALPELVKARAAELDKPHKAFTTVIGGPSLTPAVDGDGNPVVRVVVQCHLEWDD